MFFPQIYGLRTQVEVLALRFFFDFTAQERARIVWFK